MVVLFSGVVVYTKRFPLWCSTLCSCSSGLSVLIIITVTPIQLHTWLTWSLWSYLNAVARLILYSTDRVLVLSTPDYASGQSSKRKKRQAPPVRVFPDDVIVIEPIRVVNGELLVSFVVGGQEGQSAPVSGTDVASLLQAEGPSLATTLSNTVWYYTIVVCMYEHVWSAHVYERSSGNIQYYGSYGTGVVSTWSVSSNC